VGYFSSLARINRWISTKTLSHKISKTTMKALQLFIVACVFGMFTVACGGTGSSAPEGTAVDSVAPVTEPAPVVDSVIAPVVDSAAKVLDSAVSK
jgi:hypothetical protein